MMRYRALIGVLTGGVLAVGGVMLAGAPAMAETTAAVTQTYVDASGVVHYAYDPATRPGAVLSNVAGVIDRSGGCGFDAGAKGDSSTVTVIDEVSYDPSTCTHVVSVAVYPANAVPAAMTDATAPQSNTEAATTASSQKAGIVALTSWSQKLSAWIGDPVGIHVSETNITRTWDSGGGWNNYHHWGWYSPTGWWRSAYSQIDSGSVGDTIGTFKNTAFCGPTTIDQHYKTRLTTYASGAWNWSYSLNKSGACSDLLSYHYALG
jgi:hypothetical protein